MTITNEVKQIYDIIDYRISACSEMLDKYRVKYDLALDALANIPVGAPDAVYDRAKEDYHSFCSLLDSYTDQLYALQSLKCAIDRECGIYESVSED